MTKLNYLLISILMLVCNIYYAQNIKFHVKGGLNISNTKFSVIKNEIFGSPEITALENGWIDKNQFNKLVHSVKNSLYGYTLNKINLDNENK